MSAPTLRLDLQPAFSRLETTLIDLDRYASISETVIEQCLRMRNEDMAVLASIDPKAYVCLVLTEAQRDDLDFMVRTVSDRARQARDEYGAAVECAVGSGR